MPALTSQLLFAHYVSVHSWMCITRAVYTVTLWVGFTFLMRTKHKIRKNTDHRFLFFVFFGEKLKVTVGFSRKRLWNHLIQQMFNSICMKKKEEIGHMWAKNVEFFLRRIRSSLPVDPCFRIQFQIL